MYGKNKRKCVLADALHSIEPDTVSARRVTDYIDLVRQGKIPVQKIGQHLEDLAEKISELEASQLDDSVQNPQTIETMVGHLKQAETMLRKHLSPNLFLPSSSGGHGRYPAVHRPM